MQGQKSFEVSGIPSSVLLPIYRKGSPHLEVLSGFDFEEFFDEIEDTRNQDVSSLGIFLLSPQGFPKLERLEKAYTTEFYRLTTQSGQSIVLPIGSKLLVYSPQVETHESKAVEVIQKGDLPVLFMGEFPSLSEGGEFIDALSALISSSVINSLDKGISVTGVRDFLQAAVDDAQQRQNTPNTMTLQEFYQLFQEYSVYEPELDLLELLSDETPYPINPKIPIIPELFELLGYFWRYGQYTNDGRIVITVDDFITARKISYLAKKSMGAGSVIFPTLQGKRKVILDSEIHGLIFKSIFGLNGEPNYSKLPRYVYNTEYENRAGFLRAILDGNTITSKHEPTTQELVLLLLSSGMYPIIEHEHDADLIILSKQDIRSLDEVEYVPSEDHKAQNDIDPIVSIEQITYEDEVQYYRMTSTLPFYVGSGFVLTE